MRQATLEDTMDGWVSAEPHRVVQAELPLVACQSVSQSEAASSGYVEGVRKKGGSGILLLTCWSERVFERLHVAGCKSRKCYTSLWCLLQRIGPWRCWLPVTAAKTAPSSIALHLRRARAMWFVCNRLVSAAERGI